ncbi:hypothetical protein N0M98_20155 [Paenibacillus doosanensis]|uniref:hypothetical protein n=1 Tax=Paenibacillus doosanensis TaxID=1229154 RepID=UPI00217F5D8D|nr:hypothetical protein [Paenibacillus doosanensis]MCS7462439.1 hypothetical protein [Paenibacillus doosanensis]
MAENLNVFRSTQVIIGQELLKLGCSQAMVELLKEPMRVFTMRRRRRRVVF